MSAANTPTTPEDRFVEVKERRSWVTWVVVALLALLMAVTAYMAVMTALWTGHASDLKATADNLEAQVTDAQDNVETLKDDHATALAALDDAQSEIGIAAHDKADAQDHQGLYSDVSIALNSCAKERETQIGYVRDRYRYIASSLAAYENNVNSYCAKVEKNFHKIIKDEESGN